MADFLKKEYSIDTELIRGSGGIFDVKVDGDLIYSKSQTGVFPSEQDIRDKMKDVQ